MRIECRLLFAYALRMSYMERQAAQEAREGVAGGHLPSGGRHPPAFLRSQRLLDWLSAA